MSVCVSLCSQTHMYIYFQILFRNVKKKELTMISVNKGCPMARCPMGCMFHSGKNFTLFVTLTSAPRTVYDLDYMINKFSLNGLIN